MIFNDQGIEGFDVSFWQGLINFGKMKSYGTDFVIIRAGQGSYPDKKFDYNWRASKEAGIPRGAYFFFDPRTHPKTQANLFWNLVKNDMPEGRLWVDLEFPDVWGGQYTAPKYWIEMLEQLKALGATKIGIYTANWWWRKWVGLDYTYFGKYPLWVAQYTSDPADVILPRGWSSALIWQDGTPPIGAEVGVGSLEVDHNKFNGGSAEFEQEFGTSIILPPMEENVMKGTMYNYTVNVRNAAGTILGALRLNDIVVGDVKGAYPRRIYFTSVTRANGTVWNIGQLCSAVVEDSSGTTQYMKLEAVVTPPVDPPVPPSVTVKHVIEISDTGDLTIDNIPYV